MRFSLLHEKQPPPFSFYESPAWLVAPPLSSLVWPPGKFAPPLRPPNLYAANVEAKKLSVRQRCLFPALLPPLRSPRQMP